MWFLRWISGWPWWLLHFTSDVLCFFAHRIVGYRVPVVRKNLRRAFPEKTSQELKRIERDFYRHLCDVLVEIVKSLTISREEMAERVRYANPELFEEKFDQKKPMLVYAAHQANWEWLLLGGKVQLPYPCDVVYKPLASPFSEKFMKAVRGRFGGMVIPKSSAVRAIVKNRHDTRIYGIAADQVPGKKGAKLWHDFFGMATAFFPGIEQLPKLTQMDAVFLKMKKTARSRYEVEAVPLASAPYDKNSAEILPEYCRVAEQMIREQPAYWLWSHKRWKYAKQAPV